MRGVASAGYHRGMDNLTTQWNRLFTPEGWRSETPLRDALVAPSGAVRALVLELRRPADWRTLSAVWAGVQADLGWPAPAIAVNGQDAYQLWISLSEPVASSEGHAMLEALRRRYLPEVERDRVGVWPGEGQAEASHLVTLPGQMTGSDRWSAFVAPDLAAVFGDEPALDLPPGRDAQAELLAQIRSVTLSDARRLLAPLSPAAEAPVSGAVSDHGVGTCASMASGQAHHDDPRSFLLSVMNDPSVAMALRIEAAKALLAVSP